jgi:hypothetical protein
MICSNWAAKQSGDFTAILSKITAPCRSQVIETSPINRSVKRLQAVGLPLGLPVCSGCHGRRFFNEFRASLFSLIVIKINAAATVTGHLPPTFQIEFGYGRYGTDTDPQCGDTYDMRVLQNPYRHIHPRTLDSTESRRSCVSAR